LRALGLGGAAEPGGAAFEADPAGLYRANLHLRTASRVLARVGQFYAAAFSELRKKAGRLPWERYLQPGQAVTIRATSHKSKLYHSGGVAERVLGAIGDRLGQAPPPGPGRAVDEGSEGEARPELEAGSGRAPALVVVRLARDLCTLSVDSSGTLLHRRGYRLATAKAPMRETLAAGMLLAARWDPDAPLVDPFCGSGTIVIEAALLAQRAAPGAARRFAFMDWPDFDPRVWQRLVEEAEAQRSAGPFPPLVGADRDAGAIEAARANAARAGVGHLATFAHQSVSALAAPPGPGWIVTNPPYGVRLAGKAGRGGPDLRNLYAQFGRVLRERCPGWQVAVLAGDPRLAQASRLRFDPARTVRIVNGGLAVQLLQATISE
jgi:putative N6-adenine-specific DNA methylase